MKVKVYGDEYYPYYEEQPADSSFDEIEMTEAEYAAWKKADAEITAWNGLIAERLKGRGE